MTFRAINLYRNWVNVNRKEANVDHISCLQKTKNVTSCSSYRTGGVGLISEGLDSIVFYTHFRFIGKQTGLQYGGSASAVIVCMQHKHLVRSRPQKILKSQAN
jgi:hypothetical protein